MILDVAVVGAGMAGLMAAKLLQRAGLAIRVFESEAQVGGRVRSLAFHGQWIEVGAQFPSSGYRRIPALFADCGLSGSLHAASPWAGIDDSGRLRRLHPNRPWTLATSGLLNARQLVRAGMGVALGGTRGITDCYASLAKYDHEDAGVFARRIFGRAMREKVLEASVHGFYFHPLQTSSRALLEAVLGFQGCAPLAVEGGWQQLPRRLANALPISCGTHIQALRRHADRIVLESDSGLIEARHVVLAIPAPAARRLLAEPDTLEADVLNSDYASTCHLALGLRPDFQLPAELAGIHGVLRGACEADGRPAVVASMVIESVRLPQTGAPEVLGLMLGSDVARRCRSEGSDSALRTALDWLRARWPELVDAVVSHHLQHWPCAEPLSPIGRASAVARYRAGWRPERRLMLCGDYLGLPWTDGACETGAWAAERLLQRLVGPAPDAIVHNQPSNSTRSTT